MLLLMIFQNIRVLHENNGVRCTILGKYPFYFTQNHFLLKLDIFSGNENSVQFSLSINISIYQKVY